MISRTLDNIEGLTVDEIRTSSNTPNDSTFVVTFTDGSVLILEAYLHYDNCVDMRARNYSSLQPWELLDYEFIDQEKYEELVKVKRVMREQEVEKRERAKLAQLLRKYGSAK